MRSDHKAALLQALGEQGFCELRVGGRSMWPFIVESDLVTVVPPGEIPCIGSVVAAIIDDQLIVHRVIGKTSRDGHPKIVICGDSSPDSFARLQPEEIIGIVVAVCGNGKPSTRWIRPPLSFVALAAGTVLRILVRLKGLL